MQNKYNQSIIKVIIYNDDNNKASARQVMIYLDEHKLESQNSLREKSKGQSVVPVREHKQIVGFRLDPNLLAAVLLLELEDSALLKPN